MNKMALENKLKRKSQELGITYGSIQSTYFFESLLKRFERSHYQKNFCLKGANKEGFLHFCCRFTKRQNLITKIPEHKTQKEPNGID